MENNPMSPSLFLRDRSNDLMKPSGRRKMMMSKAVLLEAWAMYL
jgi:hypothetical protein